MLDRALPPDVRALLEERLWRPIADAGTIESLLLTGDPLDDPAHHPKAWLFEQSEAEVVGMTPGEALAAGALNGFRLAFIQAGEAGTAARLAGAARNAGVLVNVVDKPELCDFYTPAIIDRGRVVIAIGTGGTAPVLATRLRSQIECRLHEVRPTGNCFVVVGLVLHAAVTDTVMAGEPPARPHVDIRALDPLSRLGRDEWGLLGEVRVIQRIPYDPDAGR